VDGERDAAGDDEGDAAPEGGEGVRAGVVAVDEVEVGGVGAQGAPGQRGDIEAEEAGVLEERGVRRGEQLGFDAVGLKGAEEMEDLVLAAAEGFAGIEVEDAHGISVRRT
jgi:hypothetical protein